MIGRDGWAGLAILAFCAALWWMTLGLKDNPLVPIGPGFYPRIVIGVTAFFAVLVVIGDVLARRGGGVAGKAAQAVAERANYTLVLASFAVFGAYVLALPGLRLPHRDLPVRGGGRGAARAAARREALGLDPRARAPHHGDHLLRVRALPAGAPAARAMDRVLAA